MSRIQTPKARFQGWSFSTAGRNQGIVLLLLLGIFWIAPGQPAVAEWVRMKHGSVLDVESFQIEADRAVLKLHGGGIMILRTSNIDEILPSESGSSPRRSQATPRALSILHSPLVSPVFDPSQTLPMIPHRLEISSISRLHAVNPLLVAAVIDADTDFYELAFSTHNGRGLMMVRPEIAESVGVAARDLFVPERNIEAGTRYLRQLIQQYPDDPVRVLATYKAGGRPVGPWRRGLPDEPELRNFIFRVCASLELLVQT